MYFAIIKEQNSHIGAYSEIFRSGLFRSGRFNMVSSSEVDKLDLAQVQQTMGCSRDECGSIIGQQLGGDRVIFRNYSKVTDQIFLLSAKVLDITKGSIVTSKTINHNGDLTTLRNVLDSLAEQVTGVTTPVQFTAASTKGVSVQGGIERITPRISGNKKSQVAALFIDSIPSNADVYLGNTKAGKTPFQNLNLEVGQKIQFTLKHQDYYDKTIELYLSGGTNEMEPIPLRSKYGGIAITSEPEGADVYLAGTRVGKTPYVNPHILSGLYLVRIYKPFYFPSENNLMEVIARKETSRSFDLKPNFRSLKIDTEPAGAYILIYNEKNELVKRVISSKNVKLTPGRFRLEISKKGYESLDFEVAIPQNQTQHITKNEVTLRWLEGFLIISSSPYIKGAGIYINEKYVGSVPLEINLPAGNHKVKVSTELKHGHSEVHINDGESKSIKVKLNRSQRPPVKPVA
jgi:hypothetical protein